jgi:gliding motility-associated-like protein
MKEVGQYFKEHLDHLDKEIPSDLWNKIQNEASLKRFNKIKSIKRIVLYGVTPTVAIIALVSSLVFQTSKTDSHKITPKIAKVVSSSQNESISTKSEVVKIQRKPIESSENIVKNNPLPQTVSTVINNQSIPQIKELPASNATVKTEPLSNNNTIINKVEKPISVNNTVNKPTHLTGSSSEPKTTVPVNDNMVESDSKSNSSPDEEELLFIPKGFTPNNDGTNDQFLVKADWNVEQFEITIFQRGGAVVFKSKDIHEGWDGNYNGTELPQGAYAYMITYMNVKGDNKRVKGTINLIR